MCFQKITKICYISGKNARNKRLRSKYRQLSENFCQIFTFPTPGISLMSKDLSQINVYTYFNIGDAKSLVSRVNSPGVVHIRIFQQIWIVLLCLFSILVRLPSY